MVEEEVIRNRLKYLDEYISDLEKERHLTWEEFLTSKKTRRYVERTLQLALECCLDIGHHIIAEERLREPADNKDVFSVLHEAGFLRRSDVPRLRQMAGFRNIVVHDYTRLDPALVFGILKNGITDLVDFSLDIKEAILCGKTG
ncbi:MAG: DUF86 domain-containing protein [Firmicutes bacterium]|nr:DUF86 domain-containing protein [Bacillota bacterium]